MNFSWHCRECNVGGQISKSINEMANIVHKKGILSIPKERTLFTLLTEFVKKEIHKDCKGDIGVKAL